MLKVIQSSSDISLKPGTRRCTAVVLIGAALHRLPFLLCFVCRATRDADNVDNGRSALELYRRQHKIKPVYTLCEQLDKMLGGGVIAPQLTEFCGVPGIGKTQLAYALRRCSLSTAAAHATAAATTMMRPQLDMTRAPAARADAVVPLWHSSRAPQRCCARATASSRALRNSTEGI